MARLLRSAMGLIRRSWHLAPLGLLVDQFQLEGLPWTLVGQLHDDMANFGFIVVGIFVASWLLSAVIYRWKGYDRFPAA